VSGHNVTRGRLAGNGRKRPSLNRSARTNICYQEIAGTTAWPVAVIGRRSQPGVRCRI